MLVVTQKKYKVTKAVINELKQNAIAAPKPPYRFARTKHPIAPITKPHEAAIKENLC